MVNRIFLLQQLAKYPVFNVKIVCDLLDTKREYCRLALHRLKKAGLIRELERDKYTLQRDPLLVASYLVWPGYLSSWAALRYYNLTEQLPRYIQVVTTRARKNRQIEFQNAVIEFIRIKKEYFFGFVKVRQGDFDIFLAEKEKALADGLYLRHFSPDTFQEMVRKHQKEINIGKLRKYLRKMKLDTVPVVGRRERGRKE